MVHGKNIQKRSEVRQIMIQIWTDEERSIQERYNMWSRELVEIINESFGQKFIQQKNGRNINEAKQKKIGRNSTKEKPKN